MTQTDKDIKRLGLPDDDSQQTFIRLSGRSRMINKNSYLCCQQSAPHGGCKSQSSMSPMKAASSWSSWITPSRHRIIISFCQHERSLPERAAAAAQ